MTIPMNLPTLGSTGVVQNPGDIGAIGNALSGLPAIIQANMQLEAQKQRDAQNQLYLQAQMDQMRFQQGEAQRKAQQEQEQASAVGQFIGNISTPQTTTVGGGMMPFAFDAPVGEPMGVDEALRQLPAQYRPAAEDLGKEAIARRQKRQTEFSSKQAVERALRGIPAEQRQAARVVLGLGNDVPADVRTSIYQTLGGDGKIDGQFARTLYDTGALTAGEYAEMVGQQLPAGVDRNYRKPKAPDLIARLMAGVQVEQDYGLPQQYEVEALRNGQSMISGLQIMEQTARAPSRIVLNEMMKGKRLGALVNMSVPDDVKEWWQGASLFFNPTLRDETGAAFGEMEPMTIVDRYIDVAGDPPATKARKRAARRRLALVTVGTGRRAARYQERTGALPPGQFDEWVGMLNTDPASSWVPKGGVPK